MVQLTRHLPGLIEVEENGKQVALIRQSRWSGLWLVDNALGKHVGTFNTYAEARDFVATKLAGRFW